VGARLELEAEAGNLKRKLILPSLLKTVLTLDSDIDRAGGSLEDMFTDDKLVTDDAAEGVDNES